ncbi:MAG: sodium/solute symporter [Clostridiaceae bacterium]|jgi:SSS family transporter|nr:sodium/solute symporter [Clostridiaceae bacterium]
MEIMKLGGSAMIIFWLYFVAMLGIGVYAMRYSSDMTGFMVGKRDLGPWYMGCTFFATYMSSSVMLGNSGTAYKTGMSYMWNAFTQTMCIPIGIMIIFAALSKASRQLGVITVPGYMKKRYLSNKPSALLACMMIIFLMPYLMGIVKGSAIMIETISGLTYMNSVLLIVGVTVLYTIVGGFMAGTITDFFQAILMCFGASFVFILGLIKIGGFGNLVSGLKAIDPILVTSPGTLGWNSLVGITFVFGLAPWGLPQLVQKGFAMRDKRVIKSSVYVVLVLLILVLFTSNANGCIGRVMFGDALLEKSDYVFPMMVVTLFPPFLQGLVLAAVAAAAMSTLDGVILVIGAAIGNDLYKDVFNPKATDKQVLRVTQVVIFIVLAALAYLAQNVPTQITFLATFSHTMMASMIAAPVLGGIFSKKGTAGGCVVAQIFGAGTALIWYFMGNPFFHFFFPAIIMSFVGYFIGSKYTKPLPEDFLELLFPGGTRVKEFHWGVFNSKVAKGQQRMNA